MRDITLSLDCCEVTCGNCQYVGGGVQPECSLFVEPLTTIYSKKDVSVVYLGRRPMCLASDIKLTEEVNLWKLAFGVYK